MRDCYVYYCKSCTLEQKGYCYDSENGCEFMVEKKCEDCNSFKNGKCTDRYVVEVLRKG